MTSPQEYDVIVVGSGAAGGWAAKELTERGVSTLVLEAGRSLDPARDFPTPPAKDRSKLQLMTRARAFLDGQAMLVDCHQLAVIARPGATTMLSTSTYGCPATTRRQT